jgi:hypothetical protein
MIRRRQASHDIPAILSPAQRTLIRRALGLDRPESCGVAFRNYAVVRPDSDSLASWRDLQNRGLALTWDFGGSICFAVSGPAARTAMNKNETFDAETKRRIAEVDCHLKANQSN